MVSGQSSAQPPSRTPQLNTLALVNVQINSGLSNNGLKKLVRTVNRTSSGKIVEPNIYINFLRAGQHLSHFFTWSDLKFTHKKDILVQFGLLLTVMIYQVLRIILFNLAKFLVTILLSSQLMLANVFSSFV